VGVGAGKLNRIMSYQARTCVTVWIRKRALTTFFRIHREERSDEAAEGVPSEAKGTPRESPPALVHCRQEIAASAFGLLATTQK